MRLALRAGRDRLRPAKLEGRHAQDRPRGRPDPGADRAIGGAGPGRQRGHADRDQDKRGTDRLTVHGALVPDGDCCTYVFKARAGQRLYWTRRGRRARSAC